MIHFRFNPSNKLNIKVLILGSWLLVLFLLHGPTTQAQSSYKLKKWSFDGYLKDLQMVGYDKFNEDWMLSNEIHNRFDFRYYPTDWLSAHVGMRNRFVYGNMISLLKADAIDIESFFDYDPGYMNLTKVWATGDSYAFLSTLDRLKIDFSKGNFEASVGRQRINWGINTVWTPNDIFNSFSYFDFDYEERPGSDAIRVEYFTGMTSSAQIVASVNNADKFTLAGMYRFNNWQYDFQFLGGSYLDDMVLGLGWAGQIKGAAFRGEASYFHSWENFTDTTGQLIASIDIDYTFDNSLYTHFSAFFNSTGTTGPAGGANFILLQHLNVKNFSKARYNVFGQVGYQISPLVRADLSSMYNPCDQSIYVGPMVNISLTDNIELMMMGQLFYGEEGTEYGDYGKLWYLRLKWSF